jgi:hypothetical protein
LIFVFRKNDVVSKLNEMKLKIDEEKYLTAKHARLFIIGLL